MANIIYGPDGQPLVTSKALTVEKAAPPVEVMEGEVAKRVRSRGVSLSTVWDRNRGKPKPTPVTFETLRMMGNRAEWVRAIIKTRKNQIGRMKWSFVPKDEDDQSASTQRLIREMEKLFKRPSMYGSRPHSRSWRQFIGEVLEDILVLDAGCIEKERNRSGLICALYPVDGATIRPNLDPWGGHEDDAYVQMVEGQVTARFGMEDLVYIMDNPMTDVRFAGYGYSPLEHLVVSVTAELYASKYNSSYFEKGSVPEGLLNLGEDVDPEDVDAFRLYWMNEVMGKPWALPIVGGKGVEFMPWRQPNRDMQFMEYQNWLLKKCCAVYQIPPQEIGMLEDVNRSTADDQDNVNQTKSLEPILTLLKDYIDVEIVGEHGNGFGDIIEFEWETEGDNLEEVVAKYQALIPMGAATRAEFREELGMEAANADLPGAEGLDMYLADGQPQPLPSAEDVAVMGAAAQQQAQQEQMEQQAQMSQGPGSMPWKPADPDDPDVQSARDQHAQDQGGGFGPIENTPQGNAVGKVAPDGADRNPAMTTEQDAMVAIFEREHRKLVDGLAAILEVPVRDVEEGLR